MWTGTMWCFNSVLLLQALSHITTSYPTLHKNKRNTNRKVVFVSIINLYIIVLSRQGKDSGQKRGWHSEWSSTKIPWIQGVSKNHPILDYLISQQANDRFTCRFFLWQIVIHMLIWIQNQSCMATGGWDIYKL